MLRRTALLSSLVLSLLLAGIAGNGAATVASGNWPAFRGPDRRGIADGAGIPAEWSLGSGDNVAWRVEVPGLAHSSPIIWGQRAYLTTAVPASETPGVTTGNVDAAGIAVAEDLVTHRWLLMAFDLEDGSLAWETVAHEGTPRMGRHVKASHASQTPTTDGEVIVTLLGSEGLFAFDMEGEMLWQTDVGVMDVGLWGEPEYQWGPASSPVIWRDRVFVQNDRHEDSFVAAYDLETGQQIWRAERDEKPAWSTPLVMEGERPVLVTNGANWLRGYDPRTGEELWRLSHGDLEVIVPSPVADGETLVLTGGYPTGARPIYAIRPGASGDITPSQSGDSDGVRWVIERGSPYTPTPLIYEGILYAIVDNGILSAYDLATGERIYRTRLAVGAGFSASPVASDGRVYFASEDGDVFVVRAGPEYELIARNDMREVLMATPAITDGMLLVRGLEHLYALSGA